MRTWMATSDSVGGMRTTTSAPAFWAAARHPASTACQKLVSPLSRTPIFGAARRGPAARRPAAPSPSAAERRRRRCSMRVMGSFHPAAARRRHLVADLVDEVLGAGRALLDDILDAGAQEIALLRSQLL